MSTEVATEKLFFDAEKSKLVLENDPAAKILAAAPGDSIPDGFKVPSGAKADAAKFEADRARQAEKDAAAIEQARAAAEKKAATDAAAEEKAAAAAANKAAATPPNKGVTMVKARKGK